MPYVPPHLRVTKYEDEKPTPKIATTLAEAQAMSDAVKKEAPKNVLAEMLSAPVPKKAIAAAKRDKRPVHKAAKPTIAANSFGSLLPQTKIPSAPLETPKKVAPVTTPANSSALKVEDSVLASPEFEEAMDAILRTIFEEEMAKVKRIGNASPLNFTRRTGGSYHNERLESRFQGFKLQKLEDTSGNVSAKLEELMRSRFELAMAQVKRVGNAGALNFSRRSGGSYWNERLESRFQGYLMGALKDFGQVVLKRIANGRVTALKQVQ